MEKVQTTSTATSSVQWQAAQEPDTGEEAIERLDLRPTIPRTLKGAVGLIGVNSSVVSAWPIFFLTSVISLSFAGAAGLLIGIIVASLGMTPVYISLAEKIRRYPTAGGQYHWVAALAPQSCQKFLSFVCGVTLAFTWLTFQAANIWLGAESFMAIVLVYTGRYDVTWAFCTALGMQLVALLVNLTWGRHMNAAESLTVILHLVAVVLLTALLIFSRASGTMSSDFSFSGNTGWGLGAGTLLCITFATTTISGFDCASHLTEDTVEPSKRVPRSLLWSTTLNETACIICAVLVGLNAGDIGSLWGGPLGATGHPFGAVVQLVYNASQERRGLTTAVFGLLAAILLICSINVTAAASRTVFAVIRDDRNPYVSKWMAADLQKAGVPRITIVLVALAPALLLWINFVSAVGFQALGSQCILSLSSTYMLAISCSFWSRFHQPDLLGRDYGGIFHLGTFWFVTSASLPTSPR
ncbi:uncharacterized protein LTR77_005149 [Saxophila tyrrhenica]|uniref:Amino acid transporter n=1 Tax=Saxophila tyrrhenica TaxID=1690608 RepID=A0AAV9PBK7_9PEZI|nr:hypothetical protein LTR77_005149 [Saxophila tyrrhenica]